MPNNESDRTAQLFATDLADIDVDAHAVKTSQRMVRRTVQVRTPLAANGGDSRRDDLRVFECWIDRLQPDDNQAAAVLARTTSRTLHGIAHVATIEALRVSTHDSNDTLRHRPRQTPSPAIHPERIRPLRQSLWMDERT